MNYSKKLANWTWYQYVEPPSLLSNQVGYGIYIQQIRNIRGLGCTVLSSPVGYWQWADSNIVAACSLFSRIKRKICLAQQLYLVNHHCFTKTFGRVALRILATLLSYEGGHVRKQCSARTVWLWLRFYAVFTRPEDEQTEWEREHSRVIREEGSVWLLESLFVILVGVECACRNSSNKRRS